MTTYKQQSQVLLAKIFSHDYYVSAMEVVLKKYGLAKDTKFDGMPNTTLCLMWNDFWYELPDAPQIRRAPFFELCELSEGCPEEPEVANVESAG
jgi:hypothetical protein